MRSVPLSFLFCSPLRPVPTWRAVSPPDPQGRSPRRRQIAITAFSTAR
jgi:hypothetical protein